MADLYIDPIEVSKEITNIKKTINNIEDKISVLRSKLMVASESFVSENFEKTSHNIAITKESLKEMMINLKYANDFLNKLLEKTSVYAKNMY